MTDAVASVAAHHTVKTGTLQNNAPMTKPVEQHTADQFQAHIDKARQQVSATGPAEHKWTVEESDGPASKSWAIEPGPAEAMPRVNAKTELGNALDKVNTDWKTSHEQASSVLHDPNAGVVEVAQATIGVQKSFLTTNLIVNSTTALTKELNELKRAS